MENNDSRFIYELLKDRHSARKFLPDFQIKDEDLHLIVEAARYSPTSFGILNNRLIVVQSKEIREELLPYFYYQQSFMNSSVYLLFVVDKGDYILSESIFKAYNYINDDETMTKYQIDLSNIMSSWDDRFNLKTGSSTTEWSIAQAYVAMTSAMIQAEQLNLDTTPQEGFNREKLENFLKQHQLLNDKETVAIGLAIGKVDASKPHANNKIKVRKSLEDYLTTI